MTETIGRPRPSEALVLQRKVGLLLTDARRPVVSDDVPF